MQILHADLPRMDAEFEKERQKCRRHHVDARSVRGDGQTKRRQPNVATISERQRGCQPHRAGAEDRDIAERPLRPGHGGG